MIEMQNEKKVLIKNFKALINDLLDNYEKYTDEEKAQVKAMFVQTSELNAILDKYDVEIEFDWQEYADTVSKYFGAN